MALVLGWGGNGMTVYGAERIRVIIDSDANNEVDDQHAIAYLILNSHIFDVEGVTVNRTSAGGSIDNHFTEAGRVVQLCSASSEVKVYKGASGTYNEIKGKINDATYDGKEAVDFIINRAMADDPRPLVLIPVGKLTNIALALLKEPAIAKKIRIVWLGSNWPSAGEYNLENDNTSVNPVLDSEAPFELVTVRYGAPSGSDAVTINIDQVKTRMAGKGPKSTVPVPGRHGGTFTKFGDYSLNLFEHIGNTRSLYDVVAVAMVKNPTWGEKKVVGAPKLNGNSWEARDSNPRKVTFWENFNKAAIVEDFFSTMQNYQLPAYQVKPVALENRFMRIQPVPRHYPLFKTSFSGYSILGRDLGFNDVSAIAP